LRADETRAHRRFRWAQETFEKLRSGVDPATIIDPDTKAPIKPDASTAPVSEPEPAPAAAETPPPPTTPPPPEAQTEPPQPPLPKDCSDEDAETLHIAAAAIREMFRPSGGAEPPADEHGPVPPG